MKRLDQFTMVVCFIATLICSYILLANNIMPAFWFFVVLLIVESSLFAWISHKRKE